MKCPKCRRTMVRKEVKQGDHIYYYECRCGYSIGKPPKEDEEQVFKDVEDVEDVEDVKETENETN